MENDEMTGSELIHHERQRQVIEEAFPAWHDDKEKGGVLALGALCYLGRAQAEISSRENSVDCIPLVESESWWPWDEEDFKPNAGAIRNLVKAGAMIAAEIDRLQRAKKEGA